MLTLDPHTASAINAAQVYEDAIAYRLHRLDRPCPACTDQRKCPDHASDRLLIEVYRDKYALAVADAAAIIGPDEVAALMEPGDIPPTVALAGAAIMTQLRATAANGPAVAEMDHGLALIELDGAAIVEHPLTPAA